VAERLRNAPSAYLRQHADQPVDWWPWGVEALAEARRLDRPLFISIGYAACHWCHVMAHESFDDHDVAAVLNTHFIPIKIDREERPDLDALYMSAVTAVAGHGGWPMSVFATPDGRPFYAGTYFAPHDGGGRPGFSTVLEALRVAWRDSRDQVEQQASELSSAVANEVTFIERLAPVVTAEGTLRQLADDVASTVDEWGGFSPAPKFPRADYLEVLGYGEHSAALERTVRGITRMGLYDHLGGGLARYSTDAQWHVPHFEKMLSDQALIARSLFGLAGASGQTEWREVALDIVAFCQNYLLLDDGGYASSLDADADGVEGSHVMWDREEVAEVLTDANLAGLIEEVVRRYRLDEPGFEGHAIPRLADREPFSPPAHLAPARDALTRARAQRVQPDRDDKVVLEWNASLASALFASRDDVLMRRGADLIWWLDAHCRDGIRYTRLSKSPGRATAHDLAWLTLAAVEGAELGYGELLSVATNAASQLLEHHWDNVNGGLWTSSADVHDVPLRAKDVTDGATPSAWGVAALALYRLGRHRPHDEWSHYSDQLISLLSPLIAEHPRAVPWAVMAHHWRQRANDLVVNDTGALSDYVKSILVPFTTVALPSTGSALMESVAPGHAALCEFGRCHRPATSTGELALQLEELNGQ
jgi:uncharacterized protein YyaL (SSP411 family)